MNDSGCKMMGCIKPLLISTVLLAFFLFGSEMLIHGVWLVPLYEQTASLWRPKAEMGLSVWGILRLLVLAFTYSALYCKCCKAEMESCGTGDDKSCPKKKGLCFGVILGLLIGTMIASPYLWMPIPAELAIKWFIGGFVQGICVGIMLGCMGQKKECAAK